MTRQQDSTGLEDIPEYRRNSSERLAADRKIRVGGGSANGRRRRWNDLVRGVSAAGAAAIGLWMWGHAGNLIRDDPVFGSIVTALAGLGTGLHMLGCFDD